VKHDATMQKLTAADPETHSPDLVAANLAALQALFPELITEGADGVAVNIDVLKALVGDKTVSDADEKYGLNWHGKRRARQLALTPSTGTLRPCPEDSVDWDTTQNLMIEGDNLEVLKLLQKSYAGKVKLIYIDPPYNTGKDFVYPDNFQDNIKNYLELTGQTGEGGKKISSNTEASGRFHTDWLNMMYPRLKLARNLLREDGVIFISINDKELNNLIALCDDIFGETNHLATFVAVNEGNIDNQSRFKVNHEYIAAFGKDESKILAPPVVDPNIPESSKIFKEDIENTVVQNGPGNPVSSIKLSIGFPASFEDGVIDPKDDFWPKLSDSVRVVAGQTANIVTVTSGWKCKTLLESFIENNFQPVLDGKGQQTVFYLSNTGAVFYKKRRMEEPSHMLTVLRGLGTVQAESARLAKLGIEFSYPKPTGLLDYLIRAGTSAGDLVLDFFAGSGTTGEAAINLSKDQSSRRFILIQLPEPIDLDHYLNIAELTKERLRRAGKKTREENPLFAGDYGFRVFKLDSTNILEWDPDRDKIAETLEASIEHLKTDRTEQDILFELLLKLGLDLCVPIETKKLEGSAKQVHDLHSVGAGSLLVCLSKSIPQDDVEPLALALVAWHQELKPAGDTTVVFRDSAFADDVAKSNITAILQQHGLETVRSL
jgi:adenine-specific DNA-methyltransferase